jgi:hypothetical protein
MRHTYETFCVPRVFIMSRKVSMKYMVEVCLGKLSFIILLCFESLLHKSLFWVGKLCDLSCVLRVMYGGWFESMICDHEFLLLHVSPIFLPCVG